MNISKMSYEKTEVLVSVLEELSEKAREIADTIDGDNYDSWNRDYYLEDDTLDIANLAMKLFFK